MKNTLLIAALFTLASCATHQLKVESPQTQWYGEHGAVYAPIQGTNKYEVVIRNNDQLIAVREVIGCPCAEVLLGTVYIIEPLRIYNKPGVVKRKKKGVH